jgi:hypothetical protein
MTSNWTYETMAYFVRSAIVNETAKAAIAGDRQP